MKKILIAAAVAVFALSACGNNGTNTASDGNAVTGSGDVVSRNAGGEIVFVRLDSILSQYDKFTDLGAELETKVRNAESDLNTRARRFERNVTDYQDKTSRGLVTQREALQLQENLQLEQQQLLEREQTVRNELAEEEAVVMNNMYNDIETFLREFNADYRYPMILTTSGGTPVINADPSLDITADVVKGLNEKYAKEKSAK